MKLISLVIFILSCCAGCWYVPIFYKQLLTVTHFTCYLTGNHTMLSSWKARVTSFLIHNQNNDEGNAAEENAPVVVLDSNTKDNSTVNSGIVVEGKADDAIVLLWLCAV